MTMAPTSATSVVASFPHISPPEFEASCRELSDLYAAHQDTGPEWLAVETARSDSGAYLIVSKLLSVDPDLGAPEGACEIAEIEEEDEVSVPEHQGTAVTG